MKAIDYFDKSAELLPDRVAITDGGACYTYSQARAASVKIANAMRAAGLRDEQRVAVLSANEARVLLCILGLMRAGAAWVPLNYRNAVDGNAEYLSYVETSWLFYQSLFTEQAHALKARVPTLEHMVCIDKADCQNPGLDSFMAQGKESVDGDWGDPYGNLDHLVGIIPTGGTTGPAKGVRVTSRPWGTMLDLASLYWKCEDVDPICLDVAPLSHAAGVVANAAFAIGATNVVLPGFDPLETARAIEEHRVTHLYLPPTALYKMLALPEIRRFDYSSLRILLLAGSPVSIEKFREAAEVFGPAVCQCYGQTEAPMLLTWLDPKTVANAAAGIHPERLRSCGLPSAVTRLATMDEDGRILPPFQIGEIVARGSLVTPGYHNMPEATADVRKFGWHHTGDVGYRDEYGYFYIVDRIKDIIITGGFNVFSSEVENTIAEIPGVEECAVVAVPDDTWGEAVKAFVVPKPGASLCEEALIRECKQKLGSIKAPKSFEFCKEIPKTQAGKIDRRTLRAPYWVGIDRAVH